MTSNIFAICTTWSASSTEGPNGMIFGRGGSGGVINRVTKQAGWDPIRSFSFQAGSFGHQETAHGCRPGY